MATFDESAFDESTFDESTYDESTEAPLLSAPPMISAAAPLPSAPPMISAAAPLPSAPPIPDESDITDTTNESLNDSLNDTLNDSLNDTLPVATTPHEIPTIKPISTLHNTHAEPISETSDTNVAVAVAVATVVETDTEHQLALQYVMNQEDNEKEIRLQQEELARLSLLRQQEEQEELARQQEQERARQAHIKRVRRIMINSIENFIYKYFAYRTGINIPNESLKSKFGLSYRNMLNKELVRTLRQIISLRKPRIKTILSLQIENKITKHDHILNSIKEHIYMEEYTVSNIFDIHPCERKRSYEYRADCDHFDYLTPREYHNSISDHHAMNWFNTVKKELLALIFNM